MTLAELQDRFQAGILNEEAIAPGFVVNSKKTNAETLFAVYHNAYRLRLAEFLSNDYPVLRNYLEDEDFGSLVEAYILSAPSRVRNARWYGARLPEFMRTHARLENDIQAIDLARFERALADAFDAADGPRLSIGVLAAVSAEGWPSISFKFHPSCELLDLAVGTAALYEAVRDGQELPLIDEGEEHVLFWRSSDHQSCYRLVSPDERLALIEASAGKSFAEICSLLQFQGSGENVAARAGEFLTQWFAAGIISRLALDD
ncbi:MAG: putative DNA-binding domain-containing protein [Methylocystis sp.]